MTRAYKLHVRAIDATAKRGVEVIKPRKPVRWNSDKKRDTSHSYYKDFLWGSHYRDMKKIADSGMMRATLSFDIYYDDEIWKVRCILLDELEAEGFEVGWVQTNFNEKNLTMSVHWEHPREVYFSQ